MGKGESRTLTQSDVLEIGQAQSTWIFQERPSVVLVLAEIWYRGEDRLWIPGACWKMFHDTGRG